MTVSQPLQQVPGDPLLNLILKIPLLRGRAGVLPAKRFINRAVPGLPCFSPPRLG